MELAPWHSFWQLFNQTIHCTVIKLLLEVLVSGKLLFCPTRLAFSCRIAAYSRLHGALF